MRHQHAKRQAHQRAEEQVVEEEVGGGGQEGAQHVQQLGRALQGVGKGSREAEAMLEYLHECMSNITNIVGQWASS